MSEDAHIQSEQALLSCIIQGGPQTLLDCTEIGITNDHFSDEKNKELFKIILKIGTEGEDFNEITIGNEVEARKLGSYLDTPYLLKVTTLSDTCKAYKQYANLVLNNTKKRHLVQSIKAAEQCISEGGDTDKIIETLHSDITTISLKECKREIFTGESITKPLIDQIKSYINKDFNKNGVKTGYEKLDEMTSGFHKGQMIVIAARPSQGKSALSISRKNTERGY